MAPWGHRLQLTRTMLVPKVLELLKSANIDASTRQSCFEETRLEVKTQLVNRLSC
jgi:hypothetical protein